MKKPEIIFFDYGQTLMSESKFDSLAGTRAVLERCVQNPLGVTAQEVQDFADGMIEDIRKHDPEAHDFEILEIHNHLFQNYLYEYFQIKPTVTPLELETVFWDHAAPAVPTDGICEFLALLQERNIRTAVISNMSFSGTALANRIERFFPDNKFEFIIASSEYVFRKPHQRIFEMALKKAGIKPADAWHCGDNVRCDLEGAAGCGITPVWYTGAIGARAAQLPAGCVRIKDWSELSELVRAMEG